MYVRTDTSAQVVLSGWMKEWRVCPIACKRAAASCGRPWASRMCHSMRRDLQDLFGQNKGQHQQVEEKRSALRARIRRIHDMVLGLPGRSSGADADGVAARIKRAKATALNDIAMELNRQEIRDIQSRANQGGAAPAVRAPPRACMHAMHCTHASAAALCVECGRAARARIRTDAFQGLPICMHEVGRDTDAEHVVRVVFVRFLCVCMLPWATCGCASASVV